MMPIQVLLGQFSCFPSLKRNRSVRLLGHTVDPRPHLGGTDPSNVPGPWMHKHFCCHMFVLWPVAEPSQLGLLPMQWLGGGLQESTGGVKT